MIINRSDTILNSIPRVCERTGLGRSKVYELIAAGEIKTVKVGRRTLVPEDWLIAFAESLENNKSEAA